MRTKPKLRERNQACFCFIRCRIIDVTTLSMDTHVEFLGLLCRVGGVRLSRHKQATTYPASEHAEGILKCFGICVENDEEHVHPKNICSTCYKAAKYAMASTTYTNCSGGCGDPAQWLPHEPGVKEDGTKRCAVCSKAEQQAKGGRPPKRKRTTKPPPRTTNSPTSTTTAATNTHTSTAQVANERNTGIDMEKEKLMEIATPKYGAEEQLKPERFLSCQTTLQCSLCQNVLDRAVEAECCGNSFALNVFGSGWKGATSVLRVKQSCVPPSLCVLVEYCKVALRS